MRLHQLGRSLLKLILAPLVLAGIAAAFIVQQQHNTSRAGASSGDGSVSGLDSRGLPRAAVTYQHVSTQPEASLAYLGAHLFHPFGGPEIHDPWSTGPSSAFAGGVYSSEASMDSIYAWYDHWLQAHGWLTYHRFPLGGSWKGANGYSRGIRELIFIAEDEPQLLRSTLGTTLPRARTIFEIRYSIAPYDPNQP